MLIRDKQFGIWTLVALVNWESESGLQPPSATAVLCMAK